MAYLLIALADLCIAGQFTFNKLYEKKVACGAKHFLAFPVLTAAIAALLFLCVNKFSLAYGGFSVGLAALNGLVQALSILCGIIVVRMGPMSVYTLFMMLGGMVLPYLYGVLFLQETPSVCQIIGLFVLIATLFLSMFLKDRSQGEKKHRAFYLLCAAVFFLNGGTSIISKAHQIDARALPTYDFMVWFYLFQFAFAAVAFGVFLLCTRRNENVPPLRFTGKSALSAVGISAGYAFCTGIGYMFLLFSTADLPASFLYPIVTGGSVILTTVAAHFFFKEKIKPLMWLNLALMLAGVILFVF
ncbi:MAG TPA: EamA family transporter [Candidatus Borkfalkia avicola]|uniref:EamA family transporter n=1 Tax=Candidatus Borkfalkia avicola TaxID=2838503 RepID=A0A9D2D8C6_9FIRM|nr:EamA family transporter [Candidatus Borkfalkia avicola]